MFPGAITGPTIIMSDGRTLFDTSLASVGFGGASNNYVDATANAGFTYQGVHYTFSRWAFSGVVPSGMEQVVNRTIRSDSKETAGEPYGGTLTAQVYYIADSGGGGGSNKIRVEVVASPVAGGVVSITNSNAQVALVDPGDSVTITATAAIGYRFLYWISDSGQKITSASYYFSATADRLFVAHFKASTGLIIREG